MPRTEKETSAPSGTILILPLAFRPLLMQIRRRFRFREMLRNRAFRGNLRLAPLEAQPREAWPVGYPSGQRGQTVNLLAYAFGGSNPPPSTKTIRKSRE